MVYKETVSQTESLMAKLGMLLKQIREEKDRSKRWVERRSKDLYPEERERHISHTYLRQLEAGTQRRPNPLKLQTLAEVYQVEYRQLLAAVGYLEEEEEKEAVGEDLDGIGDRTRAELARKLFARLERQEIRPEYFLNAVLNLSEESLSIVHRLITTLSVQSRRRQTREKSAGKAP
jgi:transcriptional regulator with XRE-family HTH domain